MGSKRKANGAAATGEGSKPEQALAFAQQAAEQAGNWMQLHNVLFGIGGKVIELFPTPESRTVFMQTPEYAAIRGLIDQARDVGGDGASAELTKGASGYMSVRLPKSLHAALLTEADAEGVSLNQLCVTKLAVQLLAVTSH